MKNNFPCICGHMKLFHCCENGYGIRKEPCLCGYNFCDIVQDFGHCNGYAPDNLKYLEDRSDEIQK